MYVLKNAHLVCDTRTHECTCPLWSHVFIPSKFTCGIQPRFGNNLPEEVNNLFHELGAAVPVLSIQAGSLDVDIGGLWPPAALAQDVGSLNGSVPVTSKAVYIFISKGTIKVTITAGTPYPPWHAKCDTYPSRNQEPQPTSFCHAVCKLPYNL